MHPTYRHTQGAREKELSGSAGPTLLRSILGSPAHTLPTSLVLYPMSCTDGSPEGSLCARLHDKGRLTKSKHTHI